MQRKLKYSENNGPGAALSTINPTRSHTGPNPGRRGGRPPFNRLSYGTFVPQGIGNLRVFEFSKSDGPRLVSVSEPQIFQVSMNFSSDSLLSKQYHKKTAVIIIIKT